MKPTTHQHLPHTKQLFNLVLVFLIFNFGFAQEKKESAASICSVFSNFKISKGATCNSFQFSATSYTGNPQTTITGYNWNFGDGQTATGQNVSHTYSSNGTYTVALTTFGEAGIENCTHTLPKNVTVNCPVIVTDCGAILDFLDANDNCSPYVTYIINTSSQLNLNPGWSITEYKWTHVGVSSGPTLISYGNYSTVNLACSTYPAGVHSTLQITATNVVGDICKLTYTKDYLSGGSDGNCCSGGERMHNNSDETFVISPNPASQVVSVKFTDSNKINSSEILSINILIYNLNGRIMDSTKINNFNDLNLNVEKLEKGLYLMQLVINNEIIESKNLIIK